jgi:hypothetical protein
MFGKNIITGRQSTIRILDPHVNLKKHIAEIASYEMKNDEKLSLAEYRVKYTNKYHAKQNNMVEIENITKKLNGIFSMFSNNAFIGYNVPVDLVAQGTNITYRDIIDFLLTDEEGNIIAVELEDLSQIDVYKRQLHFWPHYYTVYSYMANSFGQDLKVILIDPNDQIKIEQTYSPTRFNNDLSCLSETLRPLQSNVLLRNFNSCYDCPYTDDCYIKVEV